MRGFAYIVRVYKSAAEATSPLSSVASLAIIKVPKANLYEMTTVIQLALESVELCPIPWFKREGI